MFVMANNSQTAGRQEYLKFEQKRTKSGAKALSFVQYLEIYLEDFKGAILSPFYFSFS